MVQDLNFINESLMYKDRATVYRFGKINNEDGSTTNILLPVGELTDIPCRLSIKKKNEPSANETVGTLNDAYSLFTNNSRTFIAGDQIKVLRYGREYKFIVGEPVIYESHQEITLTRQEWK